MNSFDVFVIKGFTVEKKIKLKLAFEEGGSVIFPD